MPNSPKSKMRRARNRPEIAGVTELSGRAVEVSSTVRRDAIRSFSRRRNIWKVGLDIGITEETALAWGVFAPVARLSPGDLAGNHVGVDAGAAIGVGVRRNALVGGSNNSIAL
jgi:hypothetical protein